MHTAVNIHYHSSRADEGHASIEIQIKYVLASTIQLKYENFIFFLEIPAKFNPLPFMKGQHLLSCHHLLHPVQIHHNSPWARLFLMIVTKFYLSSLY